MIERHIAFNVEADRTEAFERFFADRYRPALSGFPGFVAASLLREVDRPSRYRMALRWADDASGTAWRTSETHKALAPDLAALVADSSALTYEIVA